MPGRLYPINYLFIEITNACNFKCTWCPDDMMGRRRGFMKKEKVFRILDEIAAKRSWLGPIYPVKLHQMGEPMLHPDLPAIVEHAESRGVGIELNTNCGLITPENIDGALPRGPDQPDPVLPDPRRRLLQDAQGAPHRLRRLPGQGAAGGGAQGRPRGAHPPRDRHHEHEVRGLLQDRERRRAGHGLPRGLDRLRAGPRAEVRPRSPRARPRSSSAPATSSTRTRTAAATSCWTAWSSSGSAAIPGAT